MKKPPFWEIAMLLKQALGRRPGWQSRLVMSDVASTKLLLRFQHHTTRRGNGLDLGSDASGTQSTCIFSSSIFCTSMKALISSLQGSFYINRCPGKPVRNFSAARYELIRHGLKESGMLPKRQRIPAFIPRWIPLLEGDRGKVKIDTYWNFKASSNLLSCLCIDIFLSTRPTVDCLGCLCFLPPLALPFRLHVLTSLLCFSSCVLEW